MFRLKNISFKAIVRFHKIRTQEIKNYLRTIKSSASKLVEKGSNFVMATLLCLCFSIANAGQITWLPSNYSNGYAAQQQIIAPVKKVIKQALIKEKLIAKDGSSFYRQVKIKLIKNSNTPYAIVYLYSPTLFSFKTMRLDLSADYKSVIKIHDKYVMQAGDYPLSVKQEALVCPDANLNTVLFLPEYQPNPGKGSFAAWTTTIYDDIIAKVTATSGDNIKVYKGSEATKDNFLNVMSCPNLKFFMNVGSEYDDPGSSKGLYAGTAFYTGDNDSISSDDFNSTSASNTLSKVVLAGCHMFSNNTKDSFCPVMAAKKNIELYSGGATTLPIPSALLTYKCFFDSGEYTKDSLQRCANKYDPFIKNNQSSKIYIISHSKSNITVDTFDGQKHTIIPGGYIDNGYLDTSKKVYIKDIKNSSGASCSSVGIEYNKLSQGFLAIGDSNDGCRVENVAGDIPIPEQNTADGTGVVYGLFTNQSSSPAICKPIKTTFVVGVNDGSGRSIDKQCFLEGEHPSVTVKAKYAGDKIYKPVTVAASSNDPSSFSITLDPSKLIDNNVFYPYLTPGFYYSGKWKFNVESTKSIDTSKCTISVRGYNADESSLNDLTGSTEMVLSITKKSVLRKIN